MKKSNDEILFQSESGYSDLLMRKSLKLRILETCLFLFGMLFASNFIDAKSGTFKVIAISIAIAVVGLAPFFYKMVLRPRYTLTKTQLIVSISGKETAYSLDQVEPLIQGRHFYKLNGKRESLMVSREFLSHLEERLALFQKKSKRR
ncbi:hypothetical protein ACQCN2_21905 [Brevibacillus ginsengisoli]|uniref:hypothetical protein n=1 Tax=Brevibacillus ginsengisoli TaxID=363854 RepID=UPI003CF5AF7E